MNILNAYFQYRLKSLFIVRKKNDFVCSIRQAKDKCTHKIDFEENLDEFRLETKNSKRTIDVTDFGAGSKKLGQNRSIQSIYKTSVAKQKWQRFMYHLAQEHKAENILEMGTSLGFSSVYLAKSTKGTIKTIEACPATFKEADTLFNNMKIKNLIGINSTFAQYFSQLKEEKFDFIYLDGHHDGPAVLKYVDQLKKHLTPNAILLVDDIRWSDGMFSAWQTLIQDQTFTENVDLYRMGVLKKGEDA